MARATAPEPQGPEFTPIEVTPFVDEAWRPIEVPSPAAPVADIEKPAAGEKES